MKQYILILLCLVVSHLDLFSCTIFNVTKEGTTFIGNNEDWRYRDSYIKFIPASLGKYGRVFVGFGKNCKYKFGGINDQGLFYDIASLSTRDDINFDPHKETVDNPIYEKMLETCANVEEAIRLIKQYNINGFKRHHIMIVDKTGNSAILEWGSDSLEIIRKNNNYQVMTNFNNTNPNLAGWYPCKRFEIVEQKLMNLEHFSIDYIRTILESVKNNSSVYPTVYSNIYDQKNNLIYLFSNGNFEEYFKINIKEELKKEEHSYYIPLLFSNLKLQRPTDHEIISDDNVEIIWLGNSDRYKLYVSTNANFENCMRIDVNGNPVSSTNKSYGSLMFLALIPVLLFPFKRKKEVMLFYILFLMSTSLLNCTGKNSPAETIKYSYVLSDLEENMTYYWKIQTIKNNEVLVSSITKHFTTMDFNKEE